MTISDNSVLVTTSLRAGLLLLLPTLITPPVSVHGQQPAAISLGRPTAAPGEAFTSIAGVHELPDGRVLVTDDDEGRMIVLNPATGSVQTVGRKGSGPGEFRAIGPLLPAADGGVYLSDFALRRLLPITSHVQMRDPVRLPVSMQLVGSDRAGRLYGEMFLPRTTSGMNDSLIVVRWNPVATTVDSLLVYNASVSKSVRPVGAPRDAFPDADTWTVLPNGDILVVSAASYRATTFRDGHRIRSFDIPWERTRVTSAQKALFAKQQNALTPRTIGSPGPQPAAPQSEPGTYVFPAYYPVFTGGGLGGRYLRVAPDGHVWVTRTVLPGATRRAYDIIDVERGVLVGKVELPIALELAGFGRGSVYVSERNDDDELQLRRYAYPTVTSPAKPDRE